MQKLAAVIITGCLVLCLSSVAMADYTTMNIEVTNASQETVASEVHETNTTDYDVELLNPGEKTKFTDNATAWFMTVTEYLYTVKVYRQDQTDPLCAYEATMANRWDWTDWTFGPKIRYGNLANLADNAACTAKLQSTSDRDYELTVTYNGETQ